MTTIGVLGPVRATRADVPIDLGAPRQRAVLARLVAGGGHPVSVDRLVEDLWSGDPPPRAQAALQVYVSNLRRALEPDRPARTPARTLVTVAPGYALRLPTRDVDAWRFEAALRAATPAVDNRPVAAVAGLDEALACWAGATAYPEFAGEPWAQREAERLAQLRLGAVEQRAKLLLDLDRPSEVVLDLHPHVRDHPLREQAAMLLAVALYRLGRQADALDVLRTVRATLAEQLGIDASRELRSLETDLLRQSPRLEVTTRITRPESLAVAAEPGEMPAAEGRAGRPVGRTAELARLRAAADRAAGAGLGLCWVGADAGAGKSTVARHLADTLVAAGWRSVTGTCPQVAGAPPAWAWHEVVTAARRHLPLDETEAHGLRLLLHSAPPTGTRGEYDEFHLRRALAAYLSRLTRHGPLLVLVEDVHRADGETLQILRHLATALARSPVLVVATYRPHEVTDDLVAARAALAGVPAVELELGGLDADAVTELLRRHGVDSTDSELLRSVRERSAGNPLFTVELAKLIAAEGPTAALDGIPAGLGHVLARRLARLPAAARTVLRHAAVFGPDADVDLLLAVDGGPEEPVLDGLEAGVTAGLLVEPEPGRVRFAHALMREALYHSVPLLRRTRLHNRILAVLQQRRVDDVAGKGRHALAALTPATAADAISHLAAAARRAGDLGAPREAAALWAGALRAVDLAPNTPDRIRLDVHCHLAAAAALAGDVLTARAARAEAIRLATGIGDPAAVHAALTCFDAPVTWTIRPDRLVDEPLVRLLEQELSRVGDDRPVLRSRLLSVLAFEIEGADQERADQVTREGLALARRQDDPEVLCRALNARYFVTVAPAFRAELPVVGRELLATAEAAGLTAYRCEAHHILHQAALADADFDRARHHVDRAVEEATTGQLGLILAVMGWFTGLSALFRGDLEEALRRYAEVSDRMGRVGGPNAAAMGLMGRFTVLSTVGRGHEVLGEIRQVHARMPDDAHDVLAHALLSAGDHAEARRVWRPQAPIRPDYLWLYWTTLRGQVAARIGDAPAARHCYRELLPWAGRFAGLECGSISLGPVDQTLAELAATLGDPAAAARHRAAGLRLARAVGAVPWSDESAYVAAVH
ncbi:BTAD domain-containing putative transcriptional regulator [Micromonospora mirobrigensis]|uniref:DNA-binding transcriptional activator of the SARP family n=1 Tax=Micromonospora mirobrigensis TaxID=262898 RepID=A0A1C4WDC7_9ACTN|nr:BTAD domain-containing putative transcriptional regulator [Micromonospora mirobrigensis]SCE94202.1 DNA-binding transcriptional activator of the SARP family [Micromonospora mirobrigensis]